VLCEIRASQINGCAYCLDTHTKEARRLGLANQWIELVPVWRESPLYNEHERAVLNWTESVTNVSETGIPDEDFEQLHELFDERQIVLLTVAISSINVWNRMALSLRLQHRIDALPSN